MAQYAIAFDLSTKQMKLDGLSQSDVTSVYQNEIPKALYAVGFQVHPQGSLYHTNIGLCHRADRHSVTQLDVGCEAA